MKNIILQHYTGELGELEKQSVENIKKYAHRFGVDYQLVTGQVFNEKFTTPIQKLYMLDKVWDDYDTVVMLDIDMFAPKDLEENVFEVEGIGLHEDTQKRLHNNLCRTYPHLASKMYPYWGGAIYKLDRAARQQLRLPLQSNTGWMQNYNRRYHFGDEGIMHTLALKSDFKTDKPYMHKKWCQCSFLPEPEKAGFIHIRTKVTPRGPKREKIDNLKSLQQRNIIE